MDSDLGPIQRPGSVSEKGVSEEGFGIESVREGERGDGAQTWTKERHESIVESGSIKAHHLRTEHVTPYKSS